MPRKGRCFARKTGDAIAGFLHAMATPFFHNAGDGIADLLRETPASRCPFPCRTCALDFPHRRA
jgi:hypothetical protein